MQNVLFHLINKLLTVHNMAKSLRTPACSHVKYLHFLSGFVVLHKALEQESTIHTQRLNAYTKK